MYEFHGWIRLADSPSEIDEGQLDEKCERLKSFLSSISWSSGRVELLLTNGVYTLILHAVPNRRRSEAQDLVSIINKVISEFKGAYGVIYEYDELTNTEYGRGVFSVKVIKRGRCELALDPFLSPLAPAAQDL